MTSTTAETSTAVDLSPASEKDTRPRLSVVLGSTRPDRFGPTPAAWFAAEAARHAGLAVELIDLADYTLPVELGGNDPHAEPPADVARLGRQLAAADAFVIITPTYNRSYAPALKAAVDWFYSEWSLKPVGFLSYGGSAGGFTPVDHLRDVFVEFNAVPLRDAVILQNFWELFDHDGRPVDIERLRRLAQPMLDQLDWWAHLLRDARARGDFPDGASS